MRKECDLSKVRQNPDTEEIVTAAVADSLTMIASDGILHDGMGHSRVAGTFARLLGRLDFPR